MALSVTEPRCVGLLPLDDDQLALHLIGLDAAWLVLVGMVEEPDQEETGRDQNRDRTNDARLHDEVLTPVGEQHREPDGHERSDTEDEPDRRRQRTIGLTDAGAAGVGSLVLLPEELQERGLPSRGVGLQS